MISDCIILRAYYSSITESTTKMKPLLSSLFVIACCHIHLIANAQEIKGQVNDANGQPVTYASVAAKNHSTGKTTTTQTDSLGIFTYSSLPAGGPYSFI